MYRLFVHRLVGRDMGEEFAYSAIIYGPVGINLTARGATPELLNDYNAKVDFTPYILFHKRSFSGSLSMFFSEGMGRN